MPQYTTRLLLIVLISLTKNIFSQNPIIRNMFSADPSARVFGNTVYLYPSHDIVAEEGKGTKGWFCMEDYHVYSSQNLTDWTDHGVVVTQNKIPWVMPESYSMWAPDCIERNGKYYFYFPTAPKDTITYGRGFRIGVAVADHPTGAFVPQPAPIQNVRGIDPNVFIDKDGQAYLYWSAGNIYGAKLKANMLELDGPVDTLGTLPSKGLKEGPYVFERNGIYYLTYPHVENNIERLEYATAYHPLGPFTVKGVIMDESPTGCWTNHHSIIFFNKQWYLFYHHNDYSPAFDKARSVRIDSLFFNKDGSIQKVIPTLRGVGLNKANTTIQIDRYSNHSDKGITIDFIDTLDHFKGWKTVFDSAGAWVQYNSVDFGKKPFKKIMVNAMGNPGTVEVHTGSVDGPLIARIKTNYSKDWTISTAPVSVLKPGVQDLFIVLKNGRHIETDWIKFE